MSRYLLAGGRGDKFTIYLEEVTFKAGSRKRYGCKFGEKVILYFFLLVTPFHQI